jgi:Bacteriophage minor capsid protein
VVLDELGVHLQTLGLGVLSETLFLDGFPQDAPGASTPDLIAALVETPGFPPDSIHNTPAPSREHPVVQLLVRGAPYDYVTPRQWAQQIWMALGSIRNMTLSGVFYLTVRPLQSVSKLRNDDYARRIVTAQFRIDKST